ncbi:insulin-like growth factor II [Schistocerca serialis cubense]|uniref:insulin-like growth factor II n=1 Tax=Schistocerca serialis cubense TaxID=2023355 RepID=UPI00214F2FF8|nr:insulin-like growth factor II [Schistocerca serialis cubense]
MRTLLAVLCVACASALLCPRAAAEQRLRVCGRELAETLSLLCRDRGGFNDPPPPHQRAPGGVARQGGVADDCCRLGCSLSTLLRYCKFDDVVQPSRAHSDGDDGGGACVDGDEELLSLQLLHGCVATASRPSRQRPVPRRPQRQRPRQRVRQPPRQPARQPPTTPATRRPVVRGTATPYFAGRPVAVVLTPPHTQRQPATL